jgi:hypothetical protein|tara:strand:- start:167 stop:823 length:657 start_codon:yes stop_codon:yes gene_type:complete
MGNISANKLGGIGLIIGPGLATLLYLVIFVALGDAGSGNPTDFTEFTRQSSLEGFLGLLPGISLVFFFYGLVVLGNNFKDGGNNEPLYRLGLSGAFFGILGILIATSLGAGVNLDGITVDEGYESVLNLAAGSIQTYMGIIFSIGATLLALAVSSNKDGGLKIFAYIVALVGVINVVVGFINILDASTWETTFIVTPISYLIYSVWSVTLGLDLVKKS